PGLWPCAWSWPWPCVSNAVVLMAVPCAALRAPLRRRCRLSWRGLLRGGLLRREPRFVVGLAQHAHYDRHETVVHPAELDALAAVSAFVVSSEPDLVDVARDRVLLDGELRDPPRVDHVGRGHEQADLRLDGDDHRLVDLEQVILDRLRIDARAFLPRRVARAIEHAE